MKQKTENLDPVDFAPAMSARVDPNPDPVWEVVDKGGGRVPSSFLADAHEALEIQIISERFFPRSHKPNLDFPQPGYAPTPGSPGYEDLDNTQPNRNPSLPTPAKRRRRRRPAERSFEPIPGCSAPFGYVHHFAEILTERTSHGVKFILSDDTPLWSSIQKFGRVSRQVVRLALSKVDFHYNSGGSNHRNPIISRVQQLAVRLAEVLAFQEFIYPGASPFEFREEALVAMHAVLDNLEKHGEAINNQ